MPRRDHIPDTEGGSGRLPGPATGPGTALAPAAAPATHLRAILALGLPLIGSLLAQMSMGLVDTVMLGWYDVEALAGQVLGSAFFFILYLFGAGFAWAVMPLVAASSEAGDTTHLRRVTRMGLWISLLMAAAVLPLMLFSAPILKALGQDPRLADIAQTYLRVAGWGIFPGLLAMVLRSYFTALEHPRVVLWVTLLGAAVNAALNYLLIFGNFGAPELGVRGAALASASVFGLTFLVMAAIAVARFPDHRLFVRFWRPDWQVFSQVARMGLQIGLTMLAEAGLFSASTLIMGMIGTVPLVAHGIALQIISVFFMVHLGLSNAATVRAGRALGRGDEAGLRLGAAMVLALSGGFALITAAMFLAVPGRLIGLFLAPDEPLRLEILAIGRRLLVVAALFQLVDAAQVMALGLLRGVQDTRAPMVYAVVSYWLIGAPLSWGLGVALGWGGIGVWLGLTAGLAVAAVLMQGRFWLRSARIERRPGAEVTP